MWKKVWTALPHRDQARLTVDYHRAYQEFSSMGPERLPHNNKGPLTGIITMALQLGWDPHSPLEWNTTVGPLDLASEWPRRYPEVADSIMLAYWQKASQQALLRKGPRGRPRLGHGQEDR